MAFGQQSGPPATARQVKDLLGLLEQAGYGGFREARGPLGFTQRQGNGKFTQDEAAELIERLEAEAEAGPAAGAPEQRSGKAEPASAPEQRAPSRAATQRARLAKLESQLQQVPARLLAVELERRGWILIPPEDQTPPEPPVGGEGAPG
jgi:hypothetical protein